MVEDSNPHRRTMATIITDKPRVLLVDDEYPVLTAVQRHLRGIYEVTLAEGGQAALDHARGPDTFAVVCTDMRMPNVDGVAVLEAFRDLRPETTRILFTGYAEMDSAIAAVNKGNIFRFLTKPTDPETLKQAIGDAVELNRLTLAERELLEHTLRGSVRALFETLAAANPEAYARAGRIRTIVGELLVHLEVTDPWEIDVAAALSNIGAVTLPPRVVTKLHTGAPLDRQELETVEQLPAVAAQILSGIPRLDGVLKIISEQKYWTHDDVPIGTKLLRLAQDIDAMEARGLESDVILAAVKEREKEYGPEATAAFEARQSGTPNNRQVIRVPVAQLEEGMVLATDMRTADGLLLVGHGQPITASLLRRIANFAQGTGLEDNVASVLEH
jgi:response regulator RpfG family c-di-GMP phosphodiesterase